MLRRTPVVCAAFHNAPTVYPFRKPFHDTPFDEDRHRHDRFAAKLTRNTSYPRWMDEGADGTGAGIGLNRVHPLSKLRGNLSRSKQNVPYIFEMMTKGVWHKSGTKLYYRGGKPPNPSRHPYLNGEPCPVYGWKVTDPTVIRQFHVPIMEKEKLRYRAYVALHERKIMGDAAPTSETPPPPGKDVATPRKPDSQTAAKPLLKRLFFWK